MDKQFEDYKSKGMYYYLDDFLPESAYVPCDFKLAFVTQPDGEKLIKVDL